MPYTVPNQRVVTIHREPAKSDFLGIKNENWQFAARDLGAFGLLLYLYFASNANGYTLALSPAAIRQAIGMARSTYHDQFARLVDKGYLVESSGNGYDFFELPQPRHGITQKELSPVGLNFEKCSHDDSIVGQAVISIPPKDIEINNTEIPTTNSEKNISKSEWEEYIPKVKEIRIATPVAKPKKTVLPKPEKKGFEF